MLKKIGFATALAGTLLFGGVFSTSADAAYNQGSNGPAYKVYYSVNSNCAFSKQELQDYVNQYFKDYQINWNNKEGDQGEQEGQAPAKKDEPTNEQEQNNDPQSGQPENDQQNETNEQEKTPAPAEPQQPKQPQQPEQPEQEQKQGYQLNQFEQQVVNLTNQERTQRGLAPLQVNEQLSKVAREKSADMARNNYFSHTSPTYGSPFDMMKQFGISYRTAGENIAKGQRTPQEVVNAWMNSDGHRKNILNADFTQIGVGYVENGNVWTQQFIGK